MSNVHANISIENYDKCNSKITVQNRNDKKDTKLGA